MLQKENHTFRNASAPFISTIKNEFLTVSLRDDEQIEWTYGMIDGKTYITGYTITKKKVDTKEVKW